MELEVGVPPDERGPARALEHVVATLDVRSLVADRQPAHAALDQDPGDAVAQLAAHRPVDARGAEPPIGAGVEEPIDPAVTSGGQREGHERIVIT